MPAANQRPRRGEDAAKREAFDNAIEDASTFEAAGEDQEAKAQIAAAIRESVARLKADQDAASSEAKAEGTAVRAEAESLAKPAGDSLGPVESKIKDLVLGHGARKAKRRREKEAAGFEARQAQVEATVREAQRRRHSGEAVDVTQPPKRKLSGLDRRVRDAVLSRGKKKAEARRSVDTSADEAAAEEALRAVHKKRHGDSAQKAGASTPAPRPGRFDNVARRLSGAEAAELKMQQRNADMVAENADALAALSDFGKPGTRVSTPSAKVPRRARRIKEFTPPSRAEVIAEIAETPNIRVEGDEVVMGKEGKGHRQIREPLARYVADRQQPPSVDKDDPFAAALEKPKPRRLEMPAPAAEKRPIAPRKERRAPAARAPEISPAASVAPQESASSAPWERGEAGLSTKELAALNIKEGTPMPTELLNLQSELERAARLPYDKARKRREELLEGVQRMAEAGERMGADGNVQEGTGKAHSIASEAGRILEEVTSGEFSQENMDLNLIRQAKAFVEANRDGIPLDLQGQVDRLNAEDYSEQMQFVQGVDSKGSMGRWWNKKPRKQARNYLNAAKEIARHVINNYVDSGNADKRLAHNKGVRAKRKKEAENHQVRTPLGTRNARPTSAGLGNFEVGGINRSRDVQRITERMKKDGSLSQESENQWRGTEGWLSMHEAAHRAIENNPDAFDAKFKADFAKIDPDQYTEDEGLIEYMQGLSVGERPVEKALAYSAARRRVAKVDALMNRVSDQIPSVREAGISRPMAQHERNFFGEGGELGDSEHESMEAAEDDFFTAENPGEMEDAPEVVSDEASSFKAQEAFFGEGGALDAAPEPIRLTQKIEQGEPPIRLGPEDRVAPAAESQAEASPEDRREASFYENLDLMIQKADQARDMDTRNAYLDLAKAQMETYTGPNKELAAGVLASIEGMRAVDQERNDDLRFFGNLDTAIETARAQDNIAMRKVLFDGIDTQLANFDGVDKQMAEQYRKAMKELREEYLTGTVTYDTAKDMVPEEEPEVVEAGPDDEDVQEWSDEKYFARMDDLLEAIESEVDTDRQTELVQEFEHNLELYSGEAANELQVLRDDLEQLKGVETIEAGPDDEGLGTDTVELGPDNYGDLIKDELNAVLESTPGGDKRVANAVADRLEELSNMTELPGYSQEALIDAVSGWAADMREDDQEGLADQILQIAQERQGQEAA